MIMKTGRSSFSCFLCLFSVVLTTISVTATAYNSPLFSVRGATARSSNKNRFAWSHLHLPRGGNQEESTTTTDANNLQEETPTVASPKSQGLLLSTMTFSTFFASIGEGYSRQLSVHPIITKSMTAGVVFTLSDYLAQLIERKKEKDPSTVRLNKSRLLGSLLVGLCYFGPAARKFVLSFVYLNAGFL
jgi:hypothetical protein